MEKQKEVKGTPADNNELYSAIKEKVDKLKIFSKMNSWSKALKVIEPKLKEWKFFLLELDVSDETNPELSIRGYPEEGETIATEHYLEAERIQRINKNKDRDVVLVGAKSVEDLKKLI